MILQTLACIFFFYEFTKQISVEEQKKTEEQIVRTNRMLTKNITYLRSGDETPLDEENRDERFLTARPIDQ